MTDNEIIKALECYRGQKLFAFNGKKTEIYIHDIIDLINRQKADKEKLEYVLMGVMHSVDKWLEGEELNHDETNRAIIMREKTLQIVEKQQADIERLADTLKLYRNYNPAIRHATAEAIKECIKKLKEEIKQALKSNYNAVQGRIAYYENQGDMFVGDSFVDYCNGKIDCLRGLDDFCDNLAKEMVGDNEVQWSGKGKCPITPEQFNAIYEDKEGDNE